MGRGLYVTDLLKIQELRVMKVAGGRAGLQNEIKGVTIIEAPDIVKFINGGEVLLTGLYAFKSCTVEEFKVYIYELKMRNVSAIILKRGRHVDQADVKIDILLEFSETFGIPVIEVPFQVSFRDVMSLIMERLFNEEVTKLKYFKTTHDNFAALVLPSNTTEGRMEKILYVLSKLIGNPVAIFNQNLVCLASTETELAEFTFCEDAMPYEPGIYSNYTYLKQEGEYTQYLIQLKVSSGVKMYLVVTELNRTLDMMDCIAIENAITALQYEFSRQYAVTELEKKFQNDIMHNILNGKVHSVEVLKKSTNLLGVDIDGYFRVIVFGIESEDVQSSDFENRFRYMELLNNTISHSMTKVKIHNDLDKLIVIQSVEPGQIKKAYHKEIKETVERIQNYITKQNKSLKIKASVGKEVKGIMHLSESYQEANDAFMFADLASEISSGDSPQVMMFSDLGIFKLLCQLGEPDMLLEYVPESLQKLYEYKKPQRDDLLVTLKSYLDRNQNLSKTAQDLFVHYKTAAYRIEKIIKITGIDFDNANEILAVRIGLVVYKMIENHHKNFI